MRNSIGIFVAIIVLCSCVKAKPEIIDTKLIDYAVTHIEGMNERYEYRHEVFSNYKGSGGFIDKFKLSGNEIELVGKWYHFGDAKTPYDPEGIGVSISFLPNRVFFAWNYRYVYAPNGKLLAFYYVYKFGFWKIERGKLKIKLLYRYIRDGMEPVGTYQEKRKQEMKYYSVWEPLYHEEAAFQLTPFDYSGIPEEIREFYDIADKEFVRHRQVAALRFNGDDIFQCDLYDDAQPWYKFLLNPDLEDEEYMRNFLIMCITSRDGPYDFEENYYKLDFSKWQ